MATSIGNRAGNPQERRGRELGVAKVAGVTLEECVPPRVLFRFLVLLLLGTAVLRAADPRPIVGPGATKDAVIDAYGWPTGQSQSGVKEILNYPQGQVTLENGRVEKVDFSMKVPWPAPRPRPGGPTATTVKKPDAPADFWMKKYEDAVAEAKRRRARILVLFTGPDWSPGSKQFQSDVEYHPDFVNTFAGDYVFLRLEFVTRTALAPELREQNNRLRELYGVTTYPALIVISPSGTLVGAVDLEKPQLGETYRARVIAAVREVTQLLTRQPVEIAPVEVAAPVAVAPAAPAGERQAAGEVALQASLGSARWLLMGAISAGVVVALGLFWLVRRVRSAAPPPPPKVSMAARISDAASGLPSPAELSQWPKPKLCSLLAALAESDGYAAEMQGPGSDKDIILRRKGEPQPRVLICCGPIGAVVAGKGLREFFGTLTADGVEAGWFVSPAGFTPDARTYANQHNIRLIDGDHLVAQMRDLPPFILTKVLGRMG